KKPELLLTLEPDTAPTVIVTAPAPAAVSSPGAPVTFAGAASDAESGDLSGRIQWASDRDGALGSGPTITVATLSPGPHTISARARATDTRGVTSQARIGLRVRAPNAPPVVTIAAPADGAAVPAGTPVSLAATATDDFDGDLSSRIEWSSDVAGPLGTGATRTLTLHEGTHRL